MRFDYRKFLYDLLIVQLITKVDKIINKINKIEIM